MKYVKNNKLENFDNKEQENLKVYLEHHLTYRKADS